MQRRIPTVWVTFSPSTRADVYDLPMGGSIRVESAAWYTWLDEPSTTRFAYAAFDPAVGAVGCFVTIRKEQRVRGGSYWVAYRRCQGRLWKHYLGASSRLTTAALAAVGCAALTAATNRSMKGGTTTN